MAKANTQASEAKRRKKLTFKMVVDAALLIERRTGKRASEAAIRDRIGGSPNRICEMLKEWRSSTGSGAGGQRPLPGPVAEGLQPSPRDIPGSGPREAQVPSAADQGGEDDAPSAREGSAQRSDGELAALARRLDRIEEAVSTQGVDVRVLYSELAGLRRLVDSLSSVTADELRRQATARDVREPVEAPKPAPLSGGPRSGGRVERAMLRCMELLVGVGAPMRAKQLHLSLPEDLRLATVNETYHNLAYRARRGTVIRYGDKGTGTFVAGPDAAAFLARRNEPVTVPPTEAQVARVRGKKLFLAALDLLERADGRPLASKEIMRELSDGSKEGLRKVMQMLKNSFNHVRRDDDHRGIGKLKTFYVLVRDQGGATEEGTKAAPGPEG